MLSRPVRIALTTAALITTSTLLATSSATANAAGGAAREDVRMNQIQVIATHNSYHRELTDAEKDIQRKTDPGWWNLAYSHAALPLQFARQRVRSIELDVFPDPQGGLYTAPLVRRDAGLGPIGDPDLAGPGMKVLHWADHDYGTSCSTLLKCLRQVREWSTANPGHVPVPILLEFKQTDPAKEQIGGARSPKWDTGLMDRLDAEIRSVFPPRELVTPDDIRRPGLTLEQSVLKYGWPTLASSRGKVLFLMDNQDVKVQEPYTNGRPCLEGRVLFTNSRPGRPDAAFVEQNEPTGANTAQIQDLVRTGYLVRTRADVPFVEARSGDTSRLTAALSSGAQVISTDFPVPGMAARNGSDYVAELPGEVTARCNPVNAPRRCDSGRLERSGVR